MKKIIKLKEGDSIPNGAKYLHSEESKEYIGSKEKLVDAGILFNTYRTIHVYETTIYFYYEVEDNKK